MKAKFETFNDGVVDIYKVNENEELEKKLENGVRFGEENASIERHYGAKSIGTNIDKMLHIQMDRDITTHDVAVISGQQYNIEKADHYRDNTPPITKLSLTLLETAKEREYADDESKPAFQ